MKRDKQDSVGTTCPPTLKYPNATATTSSSKTAPRTHLLHEIEFLRAPLLQFLSLRDAVVLLSTSHAARNDSGSAVLALEMNPTTRHLYKGSEDCMLDWCTMPPFVHYEYSCEGHDVAQWNQPYNNQSLAACPNATSPDSLVKLLSVAGLLLHETPSWDLYRDESAYVTTWRMIPFLLPMQIENRDINDINAVREALNQVHRSLGNVFLDPDQPLSAPRIHWENLIIEANGTSNNDAKSTRSGVDVRCTFCETVVDERMKYEDAQHDDHNTFLDAHFIGSQLREAADHVSLCVSRYHPLKRFFTKYALKHVNHTQLNDYRHGAECLEHSLDKIEMIGGVTPGGVLVGVYLIPFYQ